MILLAPAIKGRAIYTINKQFLKFINGISFLAMIPGFMDM
jgi:hypothetical protein